MTPATLADALMRAAEQDHGSLTHLKPNQKTTSLRYPELLERARSLLGVMQDAGIVAGTPIIILLEDTEAFVDTFWAAVLGAMIPVPIPTGVQSQQINRLENIYATLRDSPDFGGSSWIVSFRGIAEKMKLSALGARVLLLDEIYDSSGPGEITPSDPEQPAFIQFSSGSTADPKGIVLSHRNLLSNMQAIIDAARIEQSDCSLSWMPLTHDMGLIGFHLTPVLSGSDHSLMATELFVRRPMLWLERASEMRATVLCSPNFGYRHLLKGYRQARAHGLSLGAVRLIVNGAEPISAALSDEFFNVLGPTGLKPETMFPVYGLAEASLAVSFPEPGTGLRRCYLRRSGQVIGAEAHLASDDSGCSSDYAAFVRLGKQVPGCEIQIADSDGNALAYGHIGRILIRGDNVTTRYLLRGDSGIVSARDKDNWLDTGDLGAIIGADLVVTGRAKEVIVVNGHNYHPSDLETLLSHSLKLELSRIAVCGMRRENSPSDEILLFVQHRGEGGELADEAQELTAALSRDTGLELGQIVPVARIPRTTSGKVQRFALIEAFQQGEFDSAVAALNFAMQSQARDDQPPLTDIEQQLLEICNRFLVHKNIGVDDNLLEIGESSLTLAMVYDEIENLWPGQVEVGELLEHPTIGALAMLIEAGQD